MKPMIEMFQPSRAAFAREIDSEFSPMTRLPGDPADTSRTQSFRSFYFHWRAQALLAEDKLDEAKADLNQALRPIRNVDVF